MRVITGKARGVVLKTPEGMATRNPVINHLEGAFE